jgi:hypothetical protein
VGGKALSAFALSWLLVASSAQAEDCVPPQKATAESKCVLETKDGRRGFWVADEVVVAAAQNKALVAELQKLADAQKEALGLRADQVAAYESASKNAQDAHKAQQAAIEEHKKAEATAVAAVEAAVRKQESWARAPVLWLAVGGAVAAGATTYLFGHNEVERIAGAAIGGAGVALGSIGGITIVLQNAGVVKP